MTQTNKQRTATFENIRKIWWFYSYYYPYISQGIVPNI